MAHARSRLRPLTVSAAASPRVTGAGALILDLVLKSLVGRLRPVVAPRTAHPA